jgi:N6-adenosine-specific RNA methylase IME4
VDVLEGRCGSTGGKVTYKCIAMDPPWNERGAGKSKRGADRHYPLMKSHEITQTILSAPCWQPDDEGCHLWMWVTDNFLIDGLEMMKALGFRYIRTACWTKLARPRGDVLLDILDPSQDFEAMQRALLAEFRRVQIGLGQYMRGSHELCLFGVRGRLKADEARSSAILEPRTVHSRKPDGFYGLVERVSPGPRLEMFAREQRPGWTVWGNEVTPALVV